MVKSYEASWNSLKTHHTPQWFRDAKFGIYTHWGVYSVPACGPNGTWYPFNMYREGTDQHGYHVKTYGPPSEFWLQGFLSRCLRLNDLIPTKWADLFQERRGPVRRPGGRTPRWLCYVGQPVHRLERSQDGAQA